MINLLLKAGANSEIRNSKGQLYYEFKKGEYSNEFDYNINQYLE